MTGEIEETAVRLEGVRKTYRAGAVEVAALRGISLEIPIRSFAMVVGPSGSGKTTLLNLVGCIDAPSTGAVTVCGQRIGELNDNALADFRARAIGFIFQNFNLVPVLSAYENVEYPLLLIGMPAAQRRERTLAMLDAVGLSKQGRQRPNELSGGQKQRVAIARALVKEPGLVLADEPTANLDSETGASIIELMHEVQSRFHTTFVFSTHDPHLMSHADAIFTIRDGMLVGHTEETVQMSLLLKIAFRNILRNKRRSAMTGSAIAVGALALLVFGAFTTYLFASFQTNLVQRIGHLTVFQKGYFLFGAGNPTAYGIDHYQQVMDLIENDPILKRRINVITPTQSLVGIAGNFEGANDAAKTFIGVGVVPTDRDRMRQWNEFGAGRVWPPDTRFGSSDPSIGLIGGGIARILGLCGPLKVTNCPSPPALDARRALVAANVEADPEIGDLARRDVAVSDASPSSTMPRLDLLSATANGAPNVVRLRVAGLDPQGVKELDDNYVAMQLGLAQQLVYGRGEHKATGIVIQLKRSEDLRPARVRLTELLQQHNLDLEVHDFAELTPFYTQVLGLFGSIFLFIAVIMGVIVLFAVVNTMTMNVMERTNEIGTIRAMGVRRRGIRRQFVVEGAMLGMIGATLGLVLAVIVATAVNRAGLTWNPPASVNFVPLRLELFGRPILVIGTWLGLVLVATLAALIPANRAGKLPVVDALRHV